MNRQNHLAISLFVVLILSIPASGQDILWETGYGGTLNETGAASCPAEANGLVLAGSTYSFGAGDFDIYVLRLDSLGDTLWSVTWGGTAADYGYDVTPSADGGFVVCGSTESFGNGGRDLCLVKISSTGTVLWSRQIGGSANDVGASIRLLADSGFVVGGTTASSGAGYDDFYLVRTDRNGIVQWQKTYGGAGGESGAAVRAINGGSGGFVLVGSTGSFGEGYSSIYVVRTNTVGDTLWTSTYGGSRADLGQTIEIAPDGGFLIAGATASYGAGFYDCYLVRTDPDGVQLWHDWYGGAKDDRAYSLCPLSDGGWMLAGTTESSGAGKIDLYLTRLTSEGVVMWNRTLGGSESDYARSIVSTDDGNLIAAGYSYSYACGGSDVYLAKVRLDAMTSVFEQMSPVLPDHIELEQNYPNPFNASTTISFNLHQRASAQLTIYNVLGRAVRSFTQRSLSAGTYSVTWDGRDQSGTPVASGVYFYRLSTADYSVSKKMVLLK
ncbi:T9SS type A sorting domain-containing protein [bacterium]|nr:T9SS type A sorting domain-containing protein [bacterium]